MINECLIGKETNLKCDVVIITGCSGAGKSCVLNALEDLGFFCVDNLPVMLLDPFFQLVSQSKNKGQPIVLGIDVRGGLAAENLLETVRSLAEKWNCSYKIFFLSACSDVLLKRYQETRRKHPMATSIAVPDAIEEEKKLLKPLMQAADAIIDTSGLTVHQLRHLTSSLFAEENGRQIIVSLISFGFKYGMPQESNFVYDLRSLTNPYFVPALKNLTGQDPALYTYLFAREEVQEFWDRFVSFVRYSIQKSFEEGRFFMSIGLGCTGGRHRSVAFVQRLAEEKIPHVHFLIKHRDIERERYDNQKEEAGKSSERI